MTRARRGAGRPADKEIDRLLRRASQAHSNTPAPGPCLDAETLAAFTEGSLATDERAAAEAHAADCDRCLAVLAMIARTTPPPSVQTRPSWLSIRWLVPLTTAAIAITTWVVIQDSALPLRPVQPLPPAVETAKPAERAFEAERDAQPRPLADARETKQEQPRQSTDSAARDATEETQKKPGTLARKRTDTAAQNPAPAAGARPAPPTAAPPQPVPQAAAREERLQFSARQADALPLEIPSPDPGVRWRIAARSVERSTDGGRTWTTQPTGTDVDLLAGASPAATVCWVVGRRGVVLLSTDGETWRRLDFPDATIDLVAVSALSGTAATVTAADRRTYRTVDAGRTWTLQENPAAPF